MNRACYVSMIVPGVIWAFGLSSVAGQSFGPLAVGGSSAAPVTVTLATAGRLGSISVRTLGAEKLDFTNAGGGTCTVGTVYTAGATCTVSVAFAPKYAWAPSGAVVLFSGAGATGTQLGSAPCMGWGLGRRLRSAPRRWSVWTPPRSRCRWRWTGRASYLLRIREQVL